MEKEMIMLQSEKAWSVYKEKISIGEISIKQAFLSGFYIAIIKFDAKNLLTGIVNNANEIVNVSVFHDEWCDFLNNRGDCNCNPESITEKFKKV